MSSRYLCCAYGSGICQQTVSYGIETYCWDGYSFAPSFCYQNWHNDSFCVNTPSLRNPHSTYDHTDYWPGHESLFHWTYFCFCDCFCGIMCNRTYDPCGNLQFTYSYFYNASLPSGYYSQNWFWAGLGVNDSNIDEIYINGRYCTCVTTGTTGLPNFTTYACVCCLDTSKLAQHTGDEGHIWVEGDNIWFIGDRGSYAHCVKNDGSSTFVGLAHAGSIWVGTGDYLEYVDSSGYKRRTHVGDPYGICGAITCGCCDVGTANKGYIYVNSNWVFLYFVNCSGKLIRLGNGFVYGNGP